MENITSAKFTGFTGVTGLEVVCTKDVFAMQDNGNEELDRFLTFTEGEKYAVKQMGVTYTAKSDTSTYIIGTDLQNIKAPFKLVQTVTHN
jgi:hypothetical protein